LLHEQRIGAGIYCQDARQSAVNVDALVQDDAARSVASLEEHERHALPVKLEGRREARDAAADDHDHTRGAPPPLDNRRRTRSSSIAMKGGDELSDSVRRSVIPSARAAPAACTSMSNRISV